ncbi:hypothetical protein KSD_31360 [Ktedonobacter sp. SOSP1-85]|uniref:DUF1326 domain-containing protein n=1 Tax=Ktedonobacter sp. SOSP1-85 TaxID=2778367 RepID=UPI00191620B0|nr:DUF1326 domain-containing protein [Ktedonobacter sp. SOSP1-85]GHO75365.1 hypothetical protein KSD_31360 [Ktedonobacter sp. SOSP1-85]
MTMKTLTYQLKGTVFAAQACSCPCNPCACGDHCTCEGAEAYLGPRWRFVGDQIESGTIADVDVSHRLLLSLAQNRNEHDTNWHEVVLIDDAATPEQIDMSLDLFERRQGSEVAHPERVPSIQRPVYLVPMHIHKVQGRDFLSVTFSRERSRLVRGKTPTPFFQEWTYNGHIAAQEPLDRWGENVRRG